MYQKIIVIFHTQKNIFIDLASLSSIRSSFLSLKSKNWKSLWLANKFVCSHKSHSLSQHIHSILNCLFVWHPGKWEKGNSKKGYLDFRHILSYRKKNMGTSNWKWISLSYSGLLSGKFCDCCLAPAVFSIWSLLLLFHRSLQPREKWTHPGLWKKPP